MNLTQAEGEAAVARFNDRLRRLDRNRRPLFEDGVPLVVRGIGDSSTGYGQMTARLLDGLDANGIPSRFEPIFRDDTRATLERALASRLIGRPHEGQVLMMAAPMTSSPSGSIILTMWEATHIPDHFAHNMNRHRCVIVPCEDNARWFRESGVTAPIRVVPLGIDPAIHRPKGRAYSDAFRIGAAGRVGSWAGNRKGLDVIAAAFLEAFPDQADVTLEIKTYRDCRIEIPPHPRIKLVQDVLSDEGLADWYRSLDVLVSASKGEGWGLQPHQAMACGTPVIAPYWGGHAQYMTEESGWPVEYDEAIAGDPYYTGTARWCVPRPASLIDRMREAYFDRPATRGKGEAAAVRGGEFTWERSARELAAVLREFDGTAKPKRSIRPATPSVDPAVRDAVNACPDRGVPGGLKLLEEESTCCGGGPELTECRAGRGQRPGRATLRDCLECKGG